MRALGKAHVGKTFACFSAEANMFDYEFAAFVYHRYGHGSLLVYASSIMIMIIIIIE